jgi:hypothetical protein
MTRIKERNKLLLRAMRLLCFPSRHDADKTKGAEIGRKNRDGTQLKSGLLEIELQSSVSESHPTLSIYHQNRSVDAGVGFRRPPQSSMWSLSCILDTRKLKEMFIIECRWPPRLNVVYR